MNASRQPIRSVEKVFISEKGEWNKGIKIRNGSSKLLP
jgi:hypothetical protein